MLPDHQHLVAQRFQFGPVPAVAFQVAGELGGPILGVRLRLAYAETEDPRSNDLTRVIVRLGQEENATGFAFVPQQVLREGTMRVRDLGVRVKAVTTNQDDAGGTESRRADWPDCVRNRVAELPETSYDLAMAGMPRLGSPPWIPISCS